MLSQKKTNCYPYPSHITALPCKMLNFFLWLKVMLHSTTLCWNSAHVATRRFRSLFVSRIGIWYTRCCSIQTRLYQPHLRWASSRTLNRQYYRDVLLMQKLLPAIRSIAGDVFVFQQDNAPAHCARDRDWASALWDTPVHQSLWQANSPDLNPVDNRVWGMLQERMYRLPISIRRSCGSVLLWYGPIFSRAWQTTLLISGEKDCKHVSVQKMVTCLKFQLPHITTGSFHRHQCLEECNNTFQGMKKLAFYKVVRWHFSGVVGKGAIVYFLLR